MPAVPPNRTDALGSPDLAGNVTLHEFAATDIYIDALGGNDGADGQSAVTPWQHNHRLQAAVGLYGLVAPATKLLTVHYVGKTSPAADDPFNWLVVHGADVVVVRDFSAVSGQTVYSGTLSAVRTIARATNVSAAYTDVGIGDWTPFVGKRARVTSGVAKGAVCLVLLRETATRAEVGPPAIITLGATPGAALTYPVPGDTFVIEDLPVDYQGAIDVKVRGLGGGDPWLQHANATVAPGLNQGSSKTTQAMCIVGYFGCMFPGAEDGFQTVAPHRSYFACGFLKGLFNEGAGQCILHKCAFTGTTAHTCCAATFGGTIVLLGDCIYEGRGVCGGFVAQSGGRIMVEDAAGAFNCAPGVFNPSGDGFTGHASAPQGGGMIEQCLAVGPGGVYGAGNAGVGWRVGRGRTDIANCRPTVTGVGGDFALDTATTAFTVDSATGLPVAPAAACSWANMNAAASLNGNAHRPETNSHLLTVAGS